MREGYNKQTGAKPTGVNLCQIRKLSQKSLAPKPMKPSRLLSVAWLLKKADFLEKDGSIELLAFPAETNPLGSSPADSSSYGENGLCQTR